MPACSGGQEKEPAGYPAKELDQWAARAKTWAAGGVPDDLPTFGALKPKKARRDVFVYMIAGDKVRAPAAAQALIGALGASGFILNVRRNSIPQ